VAANQDAIAEGAKVGIAAQQAMNFDASAAGVQLASAAMSRAVSEFRSTGWRISWMHRRREPERRRKPCIEAAALDGGFRLQWVQSAIDRSSAVRQHRASNTGVHEMAHITDNPPLLSMRFRQALERAATLHGADVRKGTRIPYVAHLLNVCGLVLTDGGDEDEAVAALLHDALEDHPEAVSAPALEATFGARVRVLVQGSTDTPPDYRGGQKPPWRERKLRYIDHIRNSAPDDLRVSLADKLDNARAILADYREIGEALWDRFNAPKAHQLWYYRSLVTAFRDAGVQSPMLGELDRTVSELELLTRTIAMQGSHATIGVPATHAQDDDPVASAMAIDYWAEQESTRVLQWRDPASWRASGYATAADAAADWLMRVSDPRVRARAIEIVASVLESADVKTG
jgi:GTP pyrophosphokinase